METLVIIPARGGSKGIPRKNARPLAGRPLVAHSIEQARGARSVTRVIVSTDDPEIAEITVQCGAEVVWRPPEISGDTASSESALLHALEHLECTEGYDPDLVVFLQCTSPLTESEDIDGTVDALLSEESDSALSVAPFHYFVWKRDEDGDAIGVNHDKRIRLLRQQREPQFIETGSVYVMRAKAFRETKHRFFAKTAMYVMPAERCLEIDDPVDFEVAETLMQAAQRRKKAEMLPSPIGALILDFDGVFTDNRVIVGEDGREAVVCNRSDGIGLAWLKNQGIPILVLSAERNPVVKARFDKLGIGCMHGIEDELSALQRWVGEHHIDPARAVYVGNDVPCLRAVGCGVAVGDAYPAAKACSRIVLTAPGGDGAIRELVELVQRVSQSMEGGQ